MVSGPTATDRIGSLESTGRQNNTMWVLVVSWDLLTLRKILNNVSIFLFSMNKRHRPQRQFYY